MINLELIEARCRDVVFQGGAFRWEPGFYIEDISGISGGGAVTFDSTPGAVGIHDTPNRREDPRIISVKGFIYADTTWVLGKMIDQLGNLLAADDSQADFIWQEYERGPRRARVRRFNSQEPERNGSTGFADFRIAFRAPDQRVYGATSTSPWANTVSVTNDGGYPAPVVVEVRGNKPGGYTVIGPRGKTYVVQRALAAGSVHQYLADDGILLVDGVPQTEGLTRSDQVEIPVGTWSFAVDPGCELRVIFAPTWAP